MWDALEPAAKSQLKTAGLQLYGSGTSPLHAEEQELSNPRCCKVSARSRHHRITLKSMLRDLIHAWAVMLVFWMRSDCVDPIIFLISLWRPAVSAAACDSNECEQRWQDSRELQAWSELLLSVCAQHWSYAIVGVTCRQQFLSIS